MANTTPVTPVETPATLPGAPMSVVTDSSPSVLDQLSALGAKLVNKETTVGKTGNAALWSALSVVLVAVLTAIVQNPSLFVAIHWGVLVVVANVLIVFFNNLRKPSVPNF